MIPHLRVHTEFSLLDSVIRINDLPSAESLAITDFNNMCGAYKFTVSCLKKKIHPIIGTCLSLDAGHIYIYVQNKTGYKNLCRIFNSQCTTLEQLLANETDGLLVMAGENYSPNMCEPLMKKFPGRFGVALARYPDQPSCNTTPELLKAAYDLNLPLIASNRTHFINESDCDSYDIIRCVAQKEHVDRPQRAKPSRYHRFLSQEDWQELFHDCPEAIQNTINWAKRCNFVLKEKKQTVHRSEQDIAMLNNLAHAGLAERLKTSMHAPEQEYYDRLGYELNVISTIKLEGYFLIVQDYVSWAKSQNIPTGCRGSGAGSVVAWAIGITDIDPIKFSLVFQRFLNLERVSMADFDIDFCQERRGEVIEYIKSKYGANHVAHIGTCGTMQARAILRDVGRTLGMRYYDVDALCKLIPLHPLFPIDLQKARDTQPEIERLIQSDQSVAHLWEMSQKLEGLPRHISTHAAGIVIAIDKPLSETIPLYGEQNSSMKTTQFDMYDLEKLGIIKFDVLGLSALTMIQQVVDLVEKEDGIPLDITKISLEEPKVFQYMSQGTTYGIFQVDSAGIREILKQMKPASVEDLAALNALYRPGPVGNIPLYLANRANPESIEYIFPEMARVLDETYGIIVYQEQVLQIAQLIAGYSLGEADILRRAIGKKIDSEMRKQKSTFIERATLRHGNPEKSAQLFELIEKFAQYGFVKAHAVCYAMVMYRMAYLKTFHTLRFIQSGMIIDSGNHEKLLHWQMEADREKIPLLPPCVMRSQNKFSAEDGCIRYGLGAVKGVGESISQKIYEVRQQAEFTDIWDFARRTQIHKQALEGLVYSGALDTLVDRNTALTNVIQILHQPEYSLFPPKLIEPSLRLSRLELLNHERATTGFYLSGHPLDGLPTKKLGFLPFSDVVSGLAIGSVMRSERRRMKNGTIYLVLYLSDPTGIVEISVFTEEIPKIAESEIVWCKINSGRRGFVTNKIHKLSEGLPISSVQCIFDTEEIDPSLSNLKPGKTTLVVSHDGKKWNSGRSIKLDHDTLLALMNMQNMRWTSDRISIQYPTGPRKNPNQAQ